MKLSFDGHGINHKGRRIATLSKSLRDENREIFDAYGRMFADAPTTKANHDELLDALEILLYACMCGTREELDAATYQAGETIYEITADADLEA